MIVHCTSQYFKKDTRTIPVIWEFLSLSGKECAHLLLLLQKG